MLYLHDKIFYCALGFLVGIAGASMFPWFVPVIVGIVLISIALCGKSKKLFHAIGVVFGIGLCIGAFYYTWDHARILNANLIFESKITYHGVVEKVMRGIERQKLIVGQIEITVKPYPEYHYGDVVSIEGIVTKPEKTYAQYLLNKGVVGTMRYPKIKILETGSGNMLQARLEKIKLSIEQVFIKTLPPDEAALAIGIMLGNTSYFSREFYDKLKKSGTAHLVALSGYNIAIIGTGITAIGVWWMGESALSILTLITMLLFVLMTGAESSVVRAAIMGGVLIVGNRMQRVYHPRNIIALTAGAMALQNPNIVVFDIGFQLSFLALLGIVLIGPITKNLIGIKKYGSGIIDWRESLSTTVAAQLAVLPIMVVQFTGFSWSGIIANILILPFMPITMFWGFMLGVFGLVSETGAWVIGFVVHMLLLYQKIIIDLCSMFGYIKTEGGFDKIFIVAYYATLLCIAMLYKKYNGQAE